MNIHTPQVQYTFNIFTVTNVNQKSEIGMCKNVLLNYKTAARQKYHAQLYRILKIFQLTYGIYERADVRSLTELCLKGQPAIRYCCCIIYIIRWEVNPINLDHPREMSSRREENRPKIKPLRN